MKCILSAAFFLISLIFSYSQDLNTEVLDNNKKPKLLGKIDKDGLQKEAYKSWFNQNHDDYILNKKLVKTFKDSLSHYKIKVYLGTWCGDSKRQVPRFYKLLETANYDMDKLEVYALDNKKDAYKKGPNGEEKGMKIHRVPTFVFYKDDVEVNRIVERPQETLERDVEKIVTGKRYFSKYYVANVMFDNIEKYTMEDLAKSERYYLSNFLEYTEGSKELNTLGYVYKNDKKFEKALYVFGLNTKLFPYSANAYDSLGEAYFETNNHTEALKNYTKVLELKPDDKHALEMVEKIKKEKMN